MRAEETSSGDSDKALLARHVAGDPDAFGELVRRHRDRLWAVALRTLGDREEAADAVQDALISAYRAAHTFRGQSAVTTWLHRITVNACLDRARKTASRRTSPIEDTERLEHLLEPHEEASAPAERKDLHQEVLDALRALPPEQSAALVLVDMQGYPVAEAAGILDVATGTVKSRCARGRARLLPLLSHLRPTRGGRADSDGSKGGKSTKGGTPLDGETTPDTQHGATQNDGVPETAAAGVRTADSTTDGRNADARNAEGSHTEGKEAHHETARGSTGEGDTGPDGRGNSTDGRGVDRGSITKPRDGRNRTDDASVPPAVDLRGKDSGNSASVKGGGGRA